MTRAFGLTFLKFITGGLVAAAVLTSTACKQSTAEKITAVIQEAMPTILAQKDSLNADVQQTKQAFQSFKAKIDQTPSSILNQPENAKLSQNIEEIVMKSRKLDALLPQIEAKLQELNNTNREIPPEAVQHEIDVMKELLQLQRGRMTSYLGVYKKLETQLDSIQKSPK